MRVEFSNRLGDRRFIADVTNLREANVAIHTFLQDYGYTPHHSQHLFFLLKR